MGCETKDLASACEDGNIYVWSRDPSRIVNETEQAAYLQSVIEAKEKIEQQESLAEATQNTVDGERFDLVFQVDIGDGSNLRKLCYKLSQDPNQAAKEFIERER